MEFDSPKPTTKVVFGLKHIATKTPKFAVRIGAALTAMSICGLGYSFLVDDHANWAKWMGIIGVIGAGITTLFGKK